METGVGVKPTLARIGNAGVVGTSSRPDAEFTAVRQEKGATSRGHNKKLVKLHRLLSIAPHVHGLWDMDNAMWRCLVSRLDTEFTSICEDKRSASLHHGKILVKSHHLPTVVPRHHGLGVTHNIMRHYLLHRVTVSTV